MVKEGLHLPNRWLYLPEAYPRAQACGYTLSLLS